MTSDMPLICPECYAGKHRNCDNVALDSITDDIKQCSCRTGECARPAPMPAPMPAPVPAGEVRATSSTGGQKGRKLARFSLLPAEALMQVAEHYGTGAAKYDDHNWRKGYPWSWSYDSLQRHAAAFWSGEDIDSETGSPHMAAVVFHALSLLTFMREHPSLDDRFATTTTKD